MTSAAIDDEIERIYRSLSPSEVDSAVSAIVKLRGEMCDIDRICCDEKRKESLGGLRVTVDQIVQLAELFGQRPLAVELQREAVGPRQAKHAVCGPGVCRVLDRRARQHADQRCRAR